MKARRAVGLLLVVALAGAAALVVELSAVRLLAPWFGTSSGVWTNVIGVILLALAVGYLLGARLSAAAEPRRWLGRALLFAAACTAWLPAAAGPVAGFFLPEGLTLDQAGDLVLWGSLATSVVLFVPPSVGLGCVGPLAVEALQRAQGGHAGDSGGRVLAASTLGGIAGTFFTTHVALPRLGLAHTFAGTALLLALLGFGFLVRRARPSLPSLALAAVVIGGLWDSRVRPPVVRAGNVLLESIETPYQSVRVVEEAGPSPIRRLEVNEGFGSFQSVWQGEPGLLPPGYYYNLFALPPHWSGAQGRWSVFVIGLGGGTVFRVLEGALPAGLDLDASGVEIDPGVVAISERWLDLPRSQRGRAVVSGLDGRVGLAASQAAFDQIVLDAYANQVEIPAHLATAEFFEAIADHLVPGGWLTVNVGGFSLRDPVLECLGQTAARAFGNRALALHVPFSRNFVLFVRRGAEPPEPDADALRATGLSPEIVEPLALPGTWRWFEPDGPCVLTDDRNPIEALQRASIAGATGEADGAP